MINIYPILYKRTTTGKVQIWYMEVSQDRYRSTSGQQDGKKVTTEWTVATPKNAGRANATTAEQQAIAEVEAEYEKKLARDYHMSIDRVDTAMRFKPMLATKWADRKHKVPDTVHMQPKLDGIRCIANKDGLWTREGKPIYGAPHIFEKLKPYFEYQPHMILDGELYNHDLKDDFNAIVSCVKKQKPTEQDLAVSRERIQYWIYDAPYMNDRGFAARYEHLRNFIHTDEHFVVVETLENVHVRDVDSFAADYIERGFEGAMVRISDSRYENKRSSNLIKWKEFQDHEFTIVDVQEGDGNRAGMAARIILDLGGGRTFAAGLIGNVDYCRQLLADRDHAIGKWGTVVFQNYTPDRVPRFPKFKAVRWDV